MTKLKFLNPVSLWEMVRESLKDHLGKASSTRINGYWMSILFTICVVCCVAIEITSAITHYNKNEGFSVSNQLIAIAVLILGQQALLFNLKRKAEDTPFPTVEKINTTTVPAPPDEPIVDNNIIDENLPDISADNIDKDGKPKE